MTTLGRIDALDVFAPGEGSTVAAPCSADVEAGGVEALGDPLDQPGGFADARRDHSLFAWRTVSCVAVQLQLRQALVGEVCGQGVEQRVAFVGHVGVAAVGPPVGARDQQHRAGDGTEHGESDLLGASVGAGVGHLDHDRRRGAQIDDQRAPGALAAGAADREVVGPPGCRVGRGAGVEAEKEPGRATP